MVWFKSRSVDTDKQDKLYTRWEQDYNLADIPVLGLFDEYLEMGKIVTCKRYRGSYMSAEIKCEAYRAFYLFFATSLINSIIQEHQC